MRRLTNDATDRPGRPQPTTEKQQPPQRKATAAPAVRRHRASMRLHPAFTGRCETPRLSRAHSPSSATPRLAVQNRTLCRPFAPHQPATHQAAAPQAISRVSLLIQVKEEQRGATARGRPSRWLPRQPPSRSSLPPLRHRNDTRPAETAVITRHVSNQYSRRISERAEQLAAEATTVSDFAPPHDHPEGECVECDAQRLLVNLRDDLGMSLHRIRRVAGGHGGEPDPLRRR